MKRFAWPHGISRQ